MQEMSKYLGQALLKTIIFFNNTLFVNKLPKIEIVHS